MKSDILFYCRYAQYFLEGHREDFGDAFVNLKNYFYYKFQNGLVFSTTFGGEFFSEVKRRVENNTPIEPIKDHKGNLIPLGEYDLNFNKWLKGL